jgi:hypothetical protein
MSNAVPPSGSDLSDHGQISDLFAKMVGFWSKKSDLMNLGPFLF